MDNKIQYVVFWDMTVYTSILFNGYLECQFTKGHGVISQVTFILILSSVRMSMLYSSQLIAARERFNNKIFLNRFYCFRNH